MLESYSCQKTRAVQNSGDQSRVGIQLPKLEGPTFFQSDLLSPEVLCLLFELPELKLAKFPLNLKYRWASIKHLLINVSLRVEGVCVYIYIFVPKTSIQKETYIECRSWNSNIYQFGSSPPSLCSLMLPFLKSKYLEAGLWVKRHFSLSAFWLISS